MNAILERIAEIKARGAIVPEYSPTWEQIELDAPSLDEVFPTRWEFAPMNEHIIELVEQVLSHRLPEEKKLAIAYALMSLYRFDFELDDCKEFIPC